MQRYDFLERQIEDCEARVAAQIERLTPPGGSPSGDEGAGGGSAGESGKTLSGSSGRKPAAGDRALTMALHQMMGVDLTAIPAVGTGTVLTLASEIGPDFSAFPSAKHFCFWMGLAPGTRIGGGKPLPGRAPKVVNPVGQALRMAALGARRSQTFIGAKHRARLARKDRAIAITATACELACLIYLMVTRGEEYVEKGMDAYPRDSRDQRPALRLQAPQRGVAGGAPVLACGHERVTRGPRLDPLAAGQPRPVAETGACGPYRRHRGPERAALPCPFRGGVPGGFRRPRRQLCQPPGLGPVGDGLGGVHGDADLDGMTVRVEETKTGEPLELPVTRQLVAILQRRFAECDRFPSAAGVGCFRPELPSRDTRRRLDQGAASRRRPSESPSQKGVDFCTSCQSI